MADPAPRRRSDVVSGDRTITTDPAVLDRWRAGPRWFYVVAAMLDSAAVEQRRRALATALDPWLHQTTPGQPHVTLAALGHAPVPQPPRTLQLAVGGAATFTSAAYLEVRCADIAAMRDSILDAAGRDRAAGAASGPAAMVSPESQRTEAYVPHVTVGLYRTSVELHRVHHRLAHLHPLAWLDTTAQVRLMAVDTSSPVGAMRVVTDPTAEARLRQDNNPA